MNFRIVAPVAPVRQQIVECLRNAIIECQFEPGGRLIERELCEMMGVSRSSVRESLRQLEAEGLIELIPNTGPQVAYLDKESAREIYEMRTVMEGLGARLFVQNASDSEIANLKRALDKMVSYAKSENWTGFRKAQTKFYEVLAKGGRNLILSHQLKLLRARVALLRGMLPKSRIDESLEEVGTMVRHIQLGDEKKAEQACIAHIEKSAIAALDLIESEEASKTAVSMAF